MKLHIITFRTGGYFNRIGRELREVGLTESMFASIHGIPEELYDEYYHISSLIHRNAESDRKDHWLSLPDIRAGVEEVNCWKGRQCAEVGATVMVDDKVHNVLPGCQKHGIVFIDSHHL